LELKKKKGSTEMNMVKSFHEWTPELQTAAGGKAGMLARSVIW